MRITHVITRLIIGGAQENTGATVLGLAREPEVQVDLISGPTTGPEGSLESAFDGSGRLLRVIPELVRPVRPLTDLWALGRLISIFRATRPEIVHTHSGKAGILGRIAGRRAKVPVIIHTIHGPSFGTFQGSLPNMIFTAAERWAAHSTSHFISVANAMTQQYLAAGIGQPDQVTTIGCGFELDPFLRAENDPLLRQKLGLAPEHLVVGKIGRLVGLKGHEELFEASVQIISAHPNIRFLLIGDGPSRSEFETRLRTLGISKYFFFTGLLKPAEVPRYIGIMDMLVHLSRREGLPRALPQALAAGKPVIAYDCDGAGEICIPNETGFLVAPGDLNGLIRGVGLLGSDRDLRAKFGNKGRDLVKSRFAVETMVGSIHALYRKLLAR